MRYQRPVLWLVTVAALAGGIFPVRAQLKATTYDAAYFRSRMQQVLEAWATLDPSNAARFYDQDAGNVYFDLAPMKYNGWKAYADGSKELLAEFSSGKFRPIEDAAVHRHGTLTWTTATWTLDAVMKSGEKQQLAGRWTAIWEMRGGQWLIVHEHFSVPLPPPPKATARASAQTSASAGK